MNPHEVANLKDNILKQLSERTNKRETLIALYNKLNDTTVPKEVVGGYIYDMVIDDAIKDIEVNSLRGDLFKITAKGEKILFEGGYTNLLEKQIIEDQIIEADQDRRRKKESLEIVHLTWTKILSIIAIGVSIISLLISYFKK